MNFSYKIQSGSKCSCDVKVLFDEGCKCGGGAIELAEERAKLSIVKGFKDIITIASPSGWSSIEPNWFVWEGKGDRYAHNLAIGGGVEGFVYRSNGVEIEMADKRSGVVGAFSPYGGHEERIKNLIDEGHSLGGPAYARVKGVHYK